MHTTTITFCTRNTCNVCAVVCIGCYACVSKVFCMLDVTIQVGVCSVCTCVGNNDSTTFTSPSSAVCNIKVTYAELFIANISKLICTIVTCICNITRSACAHVCMVTFFYIIVSVNTSNLNTAGCNNVWLLYFAAASNRSFGLSFSSAVTVGC